MYKPTAGEIADLWVRETKSIPLRDAIAQARALLAEEKPFIWRSQTLYSITLPKRTATIITNEGESCTCNQFHYDGVVLPLIKTQHCHHTLAWAGYTRILRAHYQLLRGHFPETKLADKWMNGEHHPPSIEAYINLSAWMEAHPAQVTASRARLEHEKERKTCNSPQP